MDTLEQKEKISIPAGRFVRFIHRRIIFFANPASLDSFKPDSFQSLSITASSLDDSEDGWCDRALGHVGRPHWTG